MWLFSPSLPKGVKKVSKGVYNIDPDIVYPIWLDMLGLNKDLYGVEVARKCITKRLQEIVDGNISVQVIYKPHWNMVGDVTDIQDACTDSLVHWNKLKKNKLV